MAEESRADMMRRLREMHDKWVDENLEDASTRFDPAAHPKPGSDYNQHHADLDASPQAQDEFHRRAREILGLTN